MFGCGFMIGAFIAFLFTLWLAAEAVDERDREIKYLRRQLAEQAKKETTFYGGIKNDDTRNNQTVEGPEAESRRVR